MNLVKVNTYTKYSPVVFAYFLLWAYFDAVVYFVVFACLILFACLGNLFAYFIVIAHVHLIFMCGREPLRN